MAVSQKKGGALLSYISMVTNVLIKFFYTPLLLRLLGQAEYGLYSLVISIVGYLAILDFGFGTTVTRYAVKYKTAGDRQGLLHLYGTLSAIYIVIGLIAFAVCAGLSLGSGALFGESMSTEEVGKLRIMILLCGINLLFSFPLQISSSILIAYERFIFKNGVQLFITLLEPIIMVLLLYFVHMKSVGAVVIVTSFNLLRYFLFYIYAVKKLDYHIALKYFDKGMIKTLLSFSVGMFLLMFFEQVQFNTGQFVLGMFHGTETVAVWGVAIIFVMNYRSLSTAITNVYMPSFLSLSFNQDKDGINSTVVKMTRYQSYVLLPILLNFFLFGYQFITIWAGTAYQEAYMAALIVMIPMTISLLLEFGYMYQMAIKDLTYRIVTLFGGFIIAFVIIYLLMGITITSFAYIMALSIVIGQVLLAIVYVRKKMSIDFKSMLSSLIKLSLPIIVITLLYYFGIRTTIQNLDMSEIWQFIIEVLVYNVLIVLAIRFFSMNNEEKRMLRIRRIN